MAKLKLTLFACVAAGLSACSHAPAVKHLGMEHNRGMASARDAQLLTNIVRASGREPLMFSAVGEVTGTANDGVSLETFAENLLDGGANLISPTLGLEGSSSAVVKVTPLSSKEFTEGILRATKPETLSHFISQGWDTEFLIPLVLGGHRCGGSSKITQYGEKVLSDGIRHTVDVTEQSAAAEEFDLREVEQGKPDVVLTVSDAEALEMVRTGVAGGYSVKSVVPAKDWRGQRIPAQSTISLEAPKKKSWKATPPTSCHGKCAASFSSDASEQSADEAALVLRSVESIIYFLGASFRPCFLGQKEECSIVYSKVLNEDEAECLRSEGHQVKANEEYWRTLFRIYSDHVPSASGAIRIRHNGIYYWVNRLDRCDTDRSLKTLSFLNQLIALQTSASDLAVTPSVIAVNAGR